MIPQVLVETEEDLLVVLDMMRESDLKFRDFIEVSTWGEIDSSIAFESRNYGPDTEGAFFFDVALPGLKSKKLEFEEVCGMPNEVIAHDMWEQLKRWKV